MVIPQVLQYERFLTKSDIVAKKVHSSHGGEAPLLLFFLHDALQIPNLQYLEENILRHGKNSVNAVYHIKSLR